MNKLLAKRFQNCLLGGAIGDAAGDPLTWLLLPQIEEKFGKDLAPVRVPVPLLRAVSAHTQFTLCTAQGLVQCLGADPAADDAEILSSIHLAYARWFASQSPKRSSRFATPVSNAVPDSVFSPCEDIPGFCYQTLQTPLQLGQPAKNDDCSNLCVIKAVPIGLAFCHNPPRAFRFAVDTTRLTHGDLSSAITSGAVAMLVAYLARGIWLNIAIEKLLNFLAGIEGHEETTDAILYSPRSMAPDKWHKALFGRGWSAAEAFAIALAAVKFTDSVGEAIWFAINHDGDSAACGALAGQLAGLIRPAPKFSCPRLISKYARDMANLSQAE